MSRVKNIGIPIDAKLHKKMRLHLIDLDKTIKDYITDLIEKDLEKKKK